MRKSPFGKESQVTESESTTTAVSDTRITQAPKLHHSISVPRHLIMVAVVSIQQAYRKRVVQRSPFLYYFTHDAMLELSSIKAYDAGRKEWCVLRLL